MLQVLLYDGEQMRVFDVVGYFPKPVEMTEYDITTLEDMFQKKAIIPNSTYQAELRTGEVKAELDPTTMKRIAKYNLDKDFEEINKNIESARSQLKALQEEISVKERKLSTINDVVKQIWEDECFDEDDYLFEKPGEDDYEEDDWE